jgi:hypothetical protein
MNGSSERAQARANRRVAGKEAWDNHFRVKRTPGQRVIFLLTLLWRALAWQYYVWKDFGNGKRRTGRKAP